MFNRDWGSVPELVIFGATVLISALYLFLQSGYGPSQRPSQNYEASQYAARADQRIAVECTQGDIATRLKCANEIDKAYREQHTSDRDLSAQQYMAIWAFLMATASFGSLAITGVGIIYIRRTLDQTVAANEAANKAVGVTEQIGFNQLRPWVLSNGPDVSAISHRSADTAVTKNEVHCIISWKNFGQSPAVDAMIYIAIVVLPVGSEITAFPHMIQYGTATIAQGEIAMSTTCKIDGIDRENFLSGKAEIIAFSRVDYRFSLVRDVSAYAETTYRIGFNGYHVDQAKGTSTPSFSISPEGPQNTAT